MKVTKKGDFTIIHLEGRLDLQGAGSGQEEEFIAILNATDPRHIIVDLENVESISSTGLRLLLKGAILIGNTGKFIIVNMNKEVEKVLKITRLMSMFTICASVDEALNK